MRPEDYYSPFRSAEDKQNYTETKGIKRISIIADLYYYSIVQSMGFDPFHDIEEGVAPILLGLASYFSYFSSYRILTKENIVIRAKQYDYGTADSHYAPKSLTVDFSSIKLSGIQTRNLLLRFIFIYGDLENHENSHLFNVIRNLITITKTVYSYEISEQSVVLLEKVVHDFLTGIKTVFETQKIIPKMHFLIHYPNMIRRLGPPIVHTTMSFENRHHPFNMKAHTFTNYSALTETLAKNNQQFFADTWSSLTEMTDVKISRQTHFSGADEDLQEFGSDIRHIKFAKGPIEIRPGFYIIKQNETLFYKIKHVLTIKGS